MDKESIKGVIFDIDGILLDSMEIWTDLGARYLKSLGIEPENGLGEILFSMSMEQGAAYMKTRYGLALTEEEIMGGLEGMLRNFYFYEVKAKPGMEELMGKFRESGVRMTAATSSPREHVERALARNGLLPYLERIFTCSEVGKSKHSPLIYDMAAAYMGTDREETLVLEDSLYALQTAARAGFHTIGVRDEKGESDQEGLQRDAEIYVTDTRDIPEFFN